MTKFSKVAYCLILMDFSCDQAALRTPLPVGPSIRPSVSPSVTPFWQCSCHRITLKFSGVITIDRRDVHEKGQGQRPEVKVTEAMDPLSRFRTVTLVWIQLYMAMQWCTKLDVASKRCPIVFQGHPSNFKVTRDQKLPILTQIGRFRTVDWVWINRWLWNHAQSLK